MYSKDFSAKLPNIDYSAIPELGSEEFHALVKALQEYAAAHPINILERMQSRLGPPLDHRRDFRYRGEGVRVLLTQDVLDFPGDPDSPSRRMHSTHLSVVSLSRQRVPAETAKEILAASSTMRREAFWKPALSRQPF